jgi:hypothetical protein
MKKKPKPRGVLAAWNRVPRTIDNAIRGLKEKDLDLRCGSEGWSIRETVHHLVEANLVASNIIIAALAMNGYNYDWTWVNPSKAWMRRVGYGTAPVEPAIETLRALCLYISGLVAAKPGALTCKVKLNDTPGAARYVMTVEKILWQEVTHAEEHLQDVREIRKASFA